MTIASAFRGLYRQPLLSLIMVIVVAMLLLSCQANAQQNIKRNNMEKENLKEIYLAGGCFWGTEHYFKQIDGVVDTEVGYANGITENPTYKEVCTDKTGFAETVHVIYNPDKVSLEFLLEMYFKAIDPTSINRQGHDTGTQYRTGVYYTDSSDEATISKVFDEEQKHIQGVIIVAVCTGNKAVIGGIVGRGMENSVKDYISRFLIKFILLFASLRNLNNAYKILGCYSTGVNIMPYICHSNPSFFYDLELTKIYAKSVSIQSDNINLEFLIYPFISTGLSG